MCVTPAEESFTIAMYLHVQYLSHKSGVTVPLVTVSDRNKPQVYLSLVATYLSNIVVWVREFEYLATKTTNYE